LRGFKVLMRDYNRNNSHDQEVLNKHLQRASRELQMVVKFLNDLDISRAEKRKLERKIAPALDLVSKIKIKIPVKEFEEVSKKKKKEVKGEKRRR